MINPVNYKLGVNAKFTPNKYIKCSETPAETIKEIPADNTISYNHNYVLPRLKML